MHKSPGKAHRTGLTLLQLFELFPDEKSATDWFEANVWPNGRACGHCGGTRTRVVPNAKPMPYHCPDCRSYFSVRTGTPMAHSKVPLRKWAIAIYLELTSLKSLSSMKLHRDIGVNQRTAWFMLHRIREVWAGRNKDDDSFDGPIEIDESHFGGRRAAMSNAKRREKSSAQVMMEKTVVMGIKDRASNHVAAKVIESATNATARDFIEDKASSETTVYSDESKIYKRLPNPHESVNHSVMEFVRGEIHTNGIESFWSMLKRAHKGVFHKMSPKHLNRYVQEFAGKHNVRDLDTAAQMSVIVASMIGRRLLYRDLIADNGLSNGSRRLSPKQ